MIKSLVAALINRHYIKKGFYSGYGVNWIKSAIEEYKNSPISTKEKLWALKRGFYPFRIAQYGLTEDNYEEYLSERDYKWLYPLNGKFRNWIDNKLTMKYILRPFDEYMAKYYFHLLKERNCHVLKLIDCPVECDCSYDGIISLLEDKTVLALKPSGGTYGIGFCKLEYIEKKYYVNNVEKSREQLHSFLQSLDDHIVIEYVMMHPEICRLYPHALNTIRVMLINEDGNNPYIASSFMRIGTKTSGIVDNTAQGGMFCKVDVQTGRYYDGEECNNHIITPAEKHPDTGEIIEGIIPHWELVKSKIIDIANYMPQIEWMGFDIAITEKGFSIIEINSHQGLHRYPTYPTDVKNYFNRKLNAKKEKYPHA